MAYYHNAPAGRKPRRNYAETGSWDEEGTHYSDRKNTRKDADEKRSFSSGSHRGGNAYGQARPPRGEKAPRRYESEDGQKRSRPGKSGEFSAPAGGKPVADARPTYRDYEYRQTARTARPAGSGRPEDARMVRDAREEKPADWADHILCGRNPIREALRSERGIEKLLVQKGELSGSAREIVREARERKIPIQEVDRRRLDEIVEHHQGLIAYTSPYRYAEVEDMLAEARKRGEDPFLVILDGVTDPHNLGAVIRTAECVGAHGVIIPVHRSVGLTPAAVKASAGAVEHMKIAKVVNLNRTIEELKQQGVWTYAVTMDGKDYEKVDFHGGTALVIGAEGDGISRLTAEKCDLRVSIPLMGTMESLNASVAAGVVMYRVLSCRRRG